MSKSTTAPAGAKAPKPSKPPKPYPGFPLTPHASGHWCKSIKGRLRYFGPWCRLRGGKWERVPGDGWQAALDRFNGESPDLYASRKPRPKPGQLTVADLCNRFLTSKKLLLDNGELSPRTFADYKRITDRLIANWGRKRLVEDLAADDFEALRATIAKTCGPVRLGGEIQQTRMVFKYGYDNGLIDRPLRYGQGFKRPTAAVIRKHRNGNGPKMFEAAEIRKMLDAAGVPLRAMILLGVNCGFGNSDCGTLPLKALDLDTGWIDYARPKTGVKRRCPLWAETVQALRAVLADRPTPKSDDAKDLFFVTKYGKSWAKNTSTNPVSAEFRKVLQALKLYRKGVGFYALRHTFETIGGESRDQPATDHIMGHAPAANDMAAVYREKISDERLIAVVEHVRAWLFGGQANG